jgi:lipoprotein-anchoring transpeptidase ErfK/SrfK
MLNPDPRRAVMKAVMRRALFVFAALAIALCAGAQAAKLDASSVNSAQWTDGSAKEIDPALVKAESLLDRAHVSPGEIDGREGDNLTKAIAAFQQSQGLGADGQLDAQTWDDLVASSADPVIVEYEITPADVKGPFTKRIPRKMEQMAHLRHLGYRNTLELLGEKFHMSPALLKALNPRAQFSKAGEPIFVANVAQPDPKRGQAAKGEVAKIQVDKGARVLRAFDRGGRLVAFYPATIGSKEKPAPSGTFKVTGVATNPTYRYNPKYAFKGVKAKRPFTIAPGPKNPVGLVWIDLSAPSYGIHGTPEPSRISKTSSHGCIRLTNWDALALAAMVRKGTQVDFVDGQASQSVARQP